MNERQMQQAIDVLTKRMGRKPTQALLSILGRDKQFVVAIESAVGVELLSDALSQIEVKLALWLEEKDTPADRAETKAYMAIIKSWSDRIARYTDNRLKFEKEIK
jgi:hypothetical protein